MRSNTATNGVELASETVVGLPNNQIQSANPFTGEMTMPHLSPFASPPSPPSVDVVMDDSDATTDDAAPSRQDLLQRAAQLGTRRTWESIVMAPTDPILGEKMQPRVAERRARFRKIVKVALGTCVAFCVVATGATALSSSSPSKSSASTSSISKTAPAAGVVPVEKLEQATHTKAVKAASHVTAAVRPAAPKKRR